MTKGRLHLRAGSLLLPAIILLVVIYLISPVQLPVIILKGALITLGGFLGYRIDRAIFPYARPDKMRDNIDQRNAMIRRAIIVGSTILAFALAV
jgi:hypothetical protein